MFSGIHQSRSGWLCQKEIIWISNLQLPRCQVPACLHNTLWPCSRCSSERCLVSAACLLLLQQTSPAGPQRASDHRETAVPLDE